MSESTTINFYDPYRSIESYNATLGGAASLDAFIEGARQNSKDRWDVRYTAREVNRWLRHGICMTDCGQPEEPTGVNVTTN